MHSQTVPTPTPTPSKAPAADLAGAIRELVLLSGSVSTGRFHAEVGRSVLELPIDRHRSLLHQWGDQAAELAQRVGLAKLPVRVMLDRNSPAPAEWAGPQRTSFSFERDPYDYRGTGGVLHDLAKAHYEDDDVLVVANGAQLIVGSLAGHVAAMSECGGDVVVVGHRDGTPSGLMLLRCAVLRSLAAEGFVDMKEQALPVIARHHEVRVLQRETPTGQPVRTLPDYLTALRIHHHQITARPVDHNPYAEDLQSTFAIVEAGARVDAAALLHDSVVLKDGTVESGAIVVRSVIGPRAVVRKGQRVIDRCIAASGAPARREVRR